MGEGSPGPGVGPPPPPPEYRGYKLSACMSLLNQIAGECRHASSGKIMANIHHSVCYAYSGSQ